VRGGCPTLEIDSTNALPLITRISICSTWLRRSADRGGWAVFSVMKFGEYVHCWYVPHPA